MNLIQFHTGTISRSVGRPMNLVFSLDTDKVDTLIARAPKSIANKAIVVTDRHVPRLELIIVRNGVGIYFDPLKQRNLAYYGPFNGAIGKGSCIVAGCIHITATEIDNG